ncbi:hypothetical protein ACVWZR_001967 [Bradyrhizobium sp. i1.3.1]
MALADETQEARVGPFWKLALPQLQQLKGAHLAIPVYKDEGGKCAATIVLQLPRVLQRSEPVDATQRYALERSLAKPLPHLYLVNMVGNA